jgi:hypothetical protein
MHLKLFLVKILIPCAPEIGVLIFFLLELQQWFLREGYAGCYPLQRSCCGADYLFSPLNKGAGVPTL